MVFDATLANRCQLSDATLDATPGAAGIRVRFGSRISYPSVRFDPRRVGLPADWSRWDALELTVSNPGGEPARFGLRVDSGAAADRGRQASFDLPPNEERKILMPLGQKTAIVGMIGQPPRAQAPPDETVLEPSATPFAAGDIKTFQIFVGKPTAPQSIVLKGARLRQLSGGPELPFVDRFGQFKGAGWPGKIGSREELLLRRDGEAKLMQASKPAPGRDAFGGWADGPKLDATGRFRVQKHRGRWWFIDPEGRLFWSSGVTGVRFNNATLVAGRENFFEWLPGPGEPESRFFGGKGARRTFDFYASNLLSKYGPGFEAVFFDVATRRLVDWGMNTIANWSDERSWALHRVPYTIPISQGGPTFVVTERLKAGKPWVRSFPDPFDPAFKERLDTRLAGISRLANDPWLLGAFIDNELPWTEGSPPRRVSAAALDLPVTSAVKAALLKNLRSAYPSPELLNTAFGTHFKSWDDAAQPWKLDARQLTHAEKGLAALDAAIADQYFRTCRDALRHHLPGALYLGCRFHTYNREAITAAKKYCDVVSFNIYGYSPMDRPAHEFAIEMDFPAIIGEFHFGATDRGMFHPGLRRSENQADRAKKYRAYLEEAVTAPWCVGAHWFQYLDQPLTGRGDGENYNIGFVNGTDDPYPELSSAAKEFHKTFYVKRCAERLATSP